MCGIAGIKGPGELKHAIDSMVRAIGRRGPDDKGIWYSKDQSLAFAHTRLSIIDLSLAGHQPMKLPNSRFTLVYNGEIYNFNDLKKELCAKGYTFQTSTDTEVLLVGWEAWGSKIVERLRGMFAFAIWDEKESELFLVRDRMGIKPMLYSEENGYFIFASNLEAMLASGKVSKNLSRESLCDLFSLGSVKQPRTIIEGIKCLEPGTILRIRKDGNKEISQYWKFEKNQNLATELASLKYSEHVVRLQELLEEACRYHMIADVPTGIFLSGGVDSSAITAIIARLSDKPIQSFSLGFESQNNLENELTEAAEAAQYLGCTHHELILNGGMVEDYFDDFVSVIDQPSIDGINTYWVSKMTSSSVKVAMSGLGGDELFAGYTHFNWALKYENQVSNFRPLLELYRSNPYRWARLHKFYLKYVGGYGRLATLRRLNYNPNLVRKIHSSFQLSNLKEDWVIEQILQQGLPNSTNMENITHYECSNYLLNTLLRDADALSMGHGLELRPVLLDNELVEFSLALPETSKIRNGINKAILKDACKDLLPTGYFDRKKKGFTLPTITWLNKELHKRLNSNINSQEARKIFSSEYLQRTIPNQLVSNNNMEPWMVLVLLEWIRTKGIELDQFKDN